MKSLLIHWRKLARLTIAAILVFGLQSLSLSALGVSQPGSNGHLAQPAEHHHLLDRDRCFHEMGRTIPVVHCHTIAAAAQALVPEWSPEPKDTALDDGDIAAFPHPAGFLLPSPEAGPSRPPAFILFANFRS